MSKLACNTSGFPPSPNVYSVPNTPQKNESPSQMTEDMLKAFKDDLDDKLEHLQSLFPIYMTAVLPDVQSFVEFSFIRNEGTAESTPEHAPLLDILRHMLQVQAGCGIWSKIVELRMQHLDISVWVQGILSHLLHEFVFESASLFDDAAILEQCIMANGASSVVAESIIQRARLRTIQEKPEIYQDRLATLREKCIDKSNRAMAPILCSSLTTPHFQIVDIAIWLKERLSSFHPERFKPINPRPWDLFDYGAHASNDIEQGFKSSRQMVSMCTMIGLEVKTSRGWQTFVPANVEIVCSDLRNETHGFGCVSDDDATYMNADEHLETTGAIDPLITPTSMDLLVTAALVDPLITAERTYPPITTQVVDVFPDEKQWNSLPTYLDDLLQTHDNAHVFRIAVPKLHDIGLRDETRFSRQKFNAITYNVKVKSDVFQLSTKPASFSFPKQAEVQPCENLNCNEWVEKFESAVCDGTLEPHSYISNLDVSKENARRKYNLAKSAISPLPCPLLDSTSKRLLGIHEPEAFMSAGFGTLFQLHIEDFELPSLNHNIHGAPKLWTTIPSSERKTLERALRHEFSAKIKLDDKGKACEQFVRHLNVYLPRDFLDKHKIQYAQFLQRAGVVVFTRQGVYHQGFNCGFNIAEARNYGGTRWCGEGLMERCWIVSVKGCGIPEGQTPIPLECILPVIPEEDGEREREVDGGKEKEVDESKEKEVEQTPKRQKVERKRKSQDFSSITRRKKKYTAKNSPPPLCADEPLYSIPPESQGLPHLTITSQNDQQDWNTLESLSRCTLHNLIVGDTVSLSVPNGPSHGLILQIRNPTTSSSSNEHTTHLLLALIWKRSLILQDTLALPAFRVDFTKSIWTKSEKAFEFMLSTEFRIVTCQAVKGRCGEGECRYSREKVYHRPFEVENTAVLGVGEMGQYFAPGGWFEGLEIGG